MPPPRASRSRAASEVTAAEIGAYPMPSAPSGTSSVPLRFLLLAQPGPAKMSAIWSLPDRKVGRQETRWGAGGQTSITRQAALRYDHRRTVGLPPAPQLLAQN